MTTARVKRQRSRVAKLREKAAERDQARDRVEVELLRELAGEATPLLPPFLLGAAPWEPEVE